MATWPELVWLLVLLIGTILGAGLRTRTWLLVDVVITFLFVIPTIPFAAESQRMETEGVTVDAAHGYLAQLYLGYALMPSVFYIMVYYDQSSSLELCGLAYLAARVLGAGLGTCLMAVAHYQHNFFTSMHLYYALLGNAAWALVSIVHLYKTDLNKEKWERLFGTKYNRSRCDVDVYLRLDVIFVVFFALPALLAPRFVLSLVQMTPDDLHVHLLQVSAALHIGTAALPSLLLYSTTSREKKAVLASRILVILLLFVLRTYHRMYDALSFYSYFISCAPFLPFFLAYLGLRESSVVYTMSSVVVSLWGK